MKYVELVTDRLGHRGGLFPRERVYHQDFIKTNYKRAMWRSYFSFGPDLGGYLDTHKALAKDFPGNAHLDRMVLDYEIEGDDGTELDETRIHVAQVIRHLTDNLDVPEEWLQVWFSGCKGFHLETGNLFGLEPAPDLPEVLKASVENLLGEGMLDTKMLHKAGLIRLPWSRHNKTGLHKIPLTIIELQSLPAREIREMAEDPPATRQGFQLNPIEEAEPIWAELVEVPRRGVLTFGGGRVGMTLEKHDPTRIVTCMQRLVQNGPRPGKRHTDLLRLASWQWRGGVPLEWAQDNLVQWLGPTIKDEEEEDEFRYHIEHVYEKGKYVYSCQDEVMKAFCSEDCIYHKKKDYAMDIANAQSMAKGYQEFLSKVHAKGLGFDLKQFYPQWSASNKSYRIVPGEVVMITGDTGMAKTACVQNWIIDLGQVTCWLNLEMAEHLVFRRFLQIAAGKTKGELEQLFMRGTEEAVQQHTQMLDHIRMLSVAPNTEQVENMVATMEPEIVVVDTTDAIEVPGAGSNDHFQLKVVMESMRKIAQRYQVVVICIHHINKSGSKEAAEGGGRQLTLNDLTGNRSNVTKVDHVFAIEGMRESPIRILRSLKTRDGSPVQVPLVADFSTFRFGEPDFEGRDNPFE